MTLQKHLESLGACQDARTWAGRKKALAAWQKCEHPDWLLWWAARTKVNTHQDIVRAACVCARSVLHVVPAREERPRLAIEAAEKWAKSPTKANKEKASTATASAASAARDAAAAAYAAAATASAASAARAAAAAYAASATASAASAARDAARAAAAYAADAYANAAAKKKELCNLIRTQLKQPWSEGK